MGLAELKDVKARAREINSSMKTARDTVRGASQGQALQAPDVLARVVAGLATLSAMVERLADHLLKDQA